MHLKHTHTHKFTCTHNQNNYDFVDVCHHAALDQYLGCLTAESKTIHVLTGWHKHDHLHIAYIHACRSFPYKNKFTQTHTQFRDYFHTQSSVMQIMLQGRVKLSQIKTHYAMITSCWATSTTHFCFSAWKLSWQKCYIKSKIAYVLDFYRKDNLHLR